MDSVQPSSHGVIEQMRLLRHEATANTDRIIAALAKMVEPLANQQSDGFKNREDRTDKPEDVAE